MADQVIRSYGIWSQEAERDLSLCATTTLLLTRLCTQLRNGVVLFNGTEKNPSQECPWVNLIPTVSHIPGVPRSCQIDN